MNWTGVWEGEVGLSELRLVERTSWNGPPEELIDVVGYVAEALRGQCQEGLLNVLERISLEHLESSQDFCLAIDQEVFECGTCNWWCERSEESDEEEGVCEDCE